MLIISVNAFAWGPIGHRIVGQIAENHLNPKTKKAVNKILENQQLAIVSNWPDFIKSDPTWNHGSVWHYVNIPDGKTYEAMEKDPKGDVIEAIARFKKVLQNPKASLVEKAQAIKFLAHLIGDIHQPLHVGKADDRGGNTTKVKWFNEETNLHHVWDESLIEFQKLSYTEYAVMLDRANKTDVAKWQNDDIAVWVKEGIDARPLVYDIGPEAKLSYDYNYKVIKFLNERLLKGGVRLAKILNDGIK